MKPYLAIFRAGPGSLHPHAIERLSAQSFDYALSWFGDEAPEVADGAVFVHRQKGTKWQGLEQTIAAYWDVIQRYRYIWLPDDDLLCVPEDVSRLFAVCEDLQLELAQPALSRDSYFSHITTLQHTAFQVRFTNFVEIMAPVLSASMLARVHPTLKDQISGFGLDALWPRYSRMGKVAIIDDITIKHTRPVGGPNYAANKRLGLHPVHEDWLVSCDRLIETQADFHINYGGLLQNGDAICLGATQHELDTMLKAVLDSCREMRVSPSAYVRYLANHLAYATGGELGRVRYPRGLLRVVLNRALEHAGLRFPAPPEDALAAV